MWQLPPALSAFGAYRRFIVYQAVPSTTRAGKTDKFPIDYRTGRKGDSQDPAIWLTWQEAAAYAEVFGPAFGVGFVFTREVGLFFIDLDNCLRDPAHRELGWNDTALALLAQFTGAAVEVSLSGEGLHIFGRGHAPEPRRKKSADPAFAFDLYTEGRFVALTGWNALGDAATDHTAALTDITARYLHRDAAAIVEGDGPCAEWNGPADDVELLRRALKSRGVGAVFGGKASFADLWDNNVPALAAAFPDDHGRADYDESRADAALAQHLAFWTGKDCERIARLMLQSQLVREKWERPDYLPRTIEAAVARQVDVLHDKPTALPAVVPPPPSTPAVAPPKVVSGDRYLSAPAQMNLFKGCVYVSALHRILVEGGYLLKPDQFRAVFGGYSFPMDPANERVVRDAYEAFTQSQCFRFPQADSVCFRPELPAGVIIQEGGARLANVWWPIDTPQADGDAGPFLRHMEKLFPIDSDRAAILAYMAALVQNPGRKFQWAPVIIGAEGNGKTLLATALTHAVGERYSHTPNTKDLGDNGLKFTGWLASKLLVVFEEIYTAERREVLEGLKPLVTNLRVEIQGKGQDQVTGDNRANLIFFSNHKDAVPSHPDARRYAIFYTAQQNAEDMDRDGLTGGYFPDLWDWFEGRNAYAGGPSGKAIVNGYLRSYAIPDALNPATQCQRAPATSSTAEAVRLSLGTIEQEVLEAVAQETPGFAGGFISSLAMTKLVERLKFERRMPPRRRHELLIGLGYEPHPALPDGRVNTVVMPDVGRPRLYVKKGSLLLNLTSGATVQEAYERAQTKTVTRGAAFISPAS